MRFIQVAPTLEILQRAFWCFLHTSSKFPNMVTKVGKFWFQSENFLKITYLKNVVKVIYQCTTEIKINWRRKCVRKAFFHYAIFSKKWVFSEITARNHSWGPWLFLRRGRIMEKFNIIFFHKLSVEYFLNMELFRKKP